MLAVHVSATITKNDLMQLSHLLLVGTFHANSKRIRDLVAIDLAFLLIFSIANRL